MSASCGIGHEKGSSCCDSFGSEAASNMLIWQADDYPKASFCVSKRLGSHPIRPAGTGLP